MDEAEFLVVLNGNGEYIYDNDGDILIQRIEDGTQFYVAPGCISPITSNTNEAIQSKENIEPDGHNNDTVAVFEESRQWTRSDILNLISLYKTNRTLFASTTMKNNKVWQIIAQKIGTHSAKQCENKFKYLRSKYMAKKDNMASTSSGAAIINFQYFEEMDEIFRKEPIVSPLSIASSSRENNILENPATSTASSMQTSTAEANYNGPRSRKAIKLKEALVELNLILKNAEEEKRRRHEEMLTLQRETTEKFLSIMGDILQKF